jgi:hypothetical protein
MTNDEERRATMIDEHLRNELFEQVGQLSPAKQWQVVRFAQSLVESPPKGVPGDRLLRFAGTMTLEEAQQFLKSIEEDCERIEPNVS